MPKQLNEYQTKRVRVSFSAAPDFVSALKSYAKQVGMNFSEAVRHLVTTGSRAENREQLILVDGIRKEVRRVYQDENRKAWREADRAVPAGAVLHAMRENTGATILSANEDGEDDWKEETEKERFERIYG